MTYDICKDWSVAQWEVFLKKRSYSGRHKSRPSGSDLSAAPPTLPPSTLASLEAGHPVPLPHPPPLSEGRGHPGEMEGALRVVPHGVSSPPPAVWWEMRRDGGGGGGHGCCGSWGRE